MDTRNTLNLTDNSIIDLQLSSKHRKQAKTIPTQELKSSLATSSSVKQEVSLSPTSASSFTLNNPHPASQLHSIMDKADDILNIKEHRRIQLQLEKKFLEQIPTFKSSSACHVDEFLAQAEDIFNQLDYSDDIRIIKIGEKLDPALQSWFTNIKCHGNFTWNDFKNALPNCLQSSSLLDVDEKRQADSVGTSLLIDLFRDHLTPFSGEGNGRPWFIEIDLKFSALKLSFQDRLEILSHFFVGDAIIWFSSNKDKMQCYTDFCRLFAREYINIEQSSSRCVSSDPKNKPPSSHFPIVANENLVNNPIDCLADQFTSIAHPSSGSVYDSSHCIPSRSTLSPTISKALIDRFVKDPLKFYGAKENVFTWLDEVEQQFKIMHLTDLDKFNLIHICLKGEAHQWYIQYKDRIASWSVFVHEITKSFTSNLQRDLAFKKLQQFHHTIHQSVIQYYAEMIKLMKQADPQMNESTKVHYLMNGLRPSLSTETRRNYPTTTQAFLEQAKIAEELTALSTTIASGSIINDDLTPATSLPYSKPTHSTSHNDFNDYSRSYDSTNHHYNNHYSSNDNDQQRYLNRIDKSSSYNSYERNPPSPLLRQGNNLQSSQHFQQSPSTGNNRNNNSQQQRKQPFSRCFKCGSSDHSARDCYHFEKRSQ